MLPPCSGVNEASCGGQKVTAGSDLDTSTGLVCSVHANVGVAVEAVGSVTRDGLADVPEVSLTNSVEVGGGIYEFGV